MIPFHLFLLSIFTKKNEVTKEQYEHDLLVKRLRDQSLDRRHTLFPYL